MTNKKKRSVIAVTLMLAMFLIGGTLSYFTADDIAHNVIAAGDFDIDLLEWADLDETIPFPDDGIEGAMPGDKIIKVVKVENTADSDAWIRVKVEKEIILPDGVAGNPDTDLIVLDIDTEHWTYQDGWYYYNDILAPGEETEPLFTTVNISENMGNMYKNSTINIDVTAQGVQVANNGTSALTATGWPA